MADRTDPWHVVHTVESAAGLNGYQVNGPANFLIFGDEVDELIALLHGIKVDDAIRQLDQLDVSVGVQMQQTIPGTELNFPAYGVPVTDEIMPATPPHTRRYIPGDEV